MRLGFWPTVYGNWLLSKRPDTRDASFAQAKRATLLAEELGFHTLLLAEHFFNPIDAGLEQLDAWTTASALAALTERIEIIAAVKPGFRAPGVIAKMASNIDQISNGRFAVNLVSAWWLPEFTMLGAPVLKHDERYARSEEFLTILKGLWTQDHYHFAGRFYTVDNATLTPKPVQQPHLPVYIGGESEQGRRLGAKLADIFLINGRPPLEIRQIIQQMRTEAATHGRTLRFGMSGFVLCRETTHEAAAEFERLSSLRDVQLQGVDADVAMFKTSAYAPKRLGTNGGTNAGLVGSPRQIADRLSEFAALGVGTFLLQFHPLLEELERFGEKVLPLLREAHSLL